MLLVGGAGACMLLVGGAGACMPLVGGLLWCEGWWLMLLALPPAATNSSHGVVYPLVFCVLLFFTVGGCPCTLVQPQPWSSPPLPPPPGGVVCPSWPQLCVPPLHSQRLPQTHRGWSSQPAC